VQTIAVVLPGNRTGSHVISLFLDVSQRRPRFSSGLGETTPTGASSSCCNSSVIGLPRAG